MGAPDDDEPIPVDDVRAMVASGQLAAFAERAARLRHWTSLTSLLERLKGLPVPLGSLIDAVQVTVRALGPGATSTPAAAEPERERRRRERSTPPAGAEALRAVRMLIGETLVERVRRPGMTEADRTALRTAAVAFADAGDWVRGAMAFQDAHEWAAAADAWGRLGDLDAMETCLAEDEEQRRARRATRSAIREIEDLMLSGERFAALRKASAIPDGIDGAATVQKIVADLTSRLVRGRSVTLRRMDEPPLRLAGTPAMLGRDAQADVVLRDPGVSRHHARLERIEGELCVVDAGSRAGTYVGGARIERPFPLRGDTEISLGSACVLELRVPAPGRVHLRGLSGLDRGLRAAVGLESIPLADFWPEAAGASIEFGEIGARLHHTPETVVRVDGNRASTRVDLLHGETVVIGDARPDGQLDASRLLLEIE